MVAAAVGLRMAVLPFLPACWAIDGLPFSLPELHVGGLPCSLPDVFLPCSSRQCLPAPISRGGGRRCSRGRGGSSRPVLALIRGPAAAACVTIINEGQRHRKGGVTSWREAGRGGATISVFTEYKLETIGDGVYFASLYLFGELANNKIWEKYIGNYWRCSNVSEIVFFYNKCERDLGEGHAVSLLHDGISMHQYFI